MSSFSHPEQPGAPARLESGFNKRLSTAVWIAFAIILVALLVRLGAHVEIRQRLASALLITLLFAVLAWILRGVTLGGAAAGFLVTSILFLAGGPGLLGAVAIVFTSTYIATLLGRNRKQALGMAERPAGRNAAQVFANVGIAALAAALSQLTPWRVPLLAASIGALAEAACDTVSSEAGKALSETAREVASWNVVPAGTEGAISFPGTLLGIAAAAAVASEAIGTNILPVRLAVLAFGAASAGMLFDGLLGSTLERRGWLTNNAVNLASTAFAALTVTCTAT